MRKNKFGSDETIIPKTKFLNMLKTLKNSEKTFDIISNNMDKKLDIYTSNIDEQKLGETIYIQNHDNNNISLSTESGETPVLNNDYYINIIEVDGKLVFENKNTCINDNCEIASGALSQGEFGNCWFNAALNCLLLGQYSRPFLLNKLKDYIKTHKIDIINLKDDSCPLMSEKNIMEVLYKTLHLNNFDIDGARLDRIRLNADIYDNKNEKFNSWKRIIKKNFDNRAIEIINNYNDPLYKSKLEKVDKINNKIKIIDGGTDIKGIEKILDKVGINYDTITIPLPKIGDISSASEMSEYLKSFKNKITSKDFRLIDFFNIGYYNYRESVIDMLKDYKILSKINVNGVIYYLNTIHLSVKVDGGSRHAVALFVCNGYLHYTNSWHNYSTKKVFKLDNNLTYKDITNHDIYNNIEKNPNKIFKDIFISSFVYVKENNLSCTSKFGKGCSDLEYLYGI
jgi:hypothetical protein